MINQNFDAKKMFQTAEEFYSSIGLFKMTDAFWNISMITRPSDGREVDCYADSEEFYHYPEYGIKMCAKVNMQDLITIHHEMGHSEYFMAYGPQAIKFHDGANSGF